jgi:hypothetical protein
MLGTNAVSLNFQVYFGTGADRDKLLIGTDYAAAYRKSNAVFRDPSAWYHLVVTVDTTNATDTNRIRAYINNQEISWATNNSITQNADLGWNTTTQHGIGTKSGSSLYFDGYMAEFHNIDGQALTPSDFGETDTATGVWKPKKYTGTYGTNGFYLKFDNLTSTSTLGNDSSGNSNTWTVNNISLTSGATYDSMKDVPTLTDADTANYCVLNPLNNRTGTVSNGNLTWTATASSGYLCLGTMAFDIASSTNKYYFEFTFTSGEGLFGIAPSTLDGDAPGRVGTYSYYSSTGDKYNGTSGSSYGSSFTNGDIIGVAVGSGEVVFYKNNVSQGAAFTGLTGMFVPMMCEVTMTASANFGQRPFAYTPPSGFKALNTFNLPTPTIGATASSQANKYFDVATYAGDGTSTRTITTSPNFTPDLYWLKNRTDGFSHLLYDRIRGAGENADLASNTTAVEGDNNTNATFGYVSAFTSDGITVVKGSNSVGYTNTSGHNYVAWQWRASGSTVSNTDGSITSTVSANTTAGFSIVTYTGTGSNATVGHGLGVAPSMIIVRNRSIQQNFIIGHTSVWDSNVNSFLLFTTSGTSTNSAIWNGTRPTSTTISIGTDSGTNGNGNSHVAWCFAEVAGYSKFGSYTGNGSADGPFIYLGFRPKFFLWKDISNSTANWVIYDSSRNQYNVLSLGIRPNLSDAESDFGSTYYADFLSNGIKIRGSGNGFNQSSTTVIYAAFAENPFKYSLAR